MIILLKSLILKKEGATAIEYGLIASLLSIAIIGAVTSLGESMDTMFTGTSDKVNEAVANAEATLED